MNKIRPVNLDLTTLTFPVMAIASIFHRISGVALFMLLPFILYLLERSLQSPASFMELGMQLQHPFYKLLVWAFTTALAYHVLAGIRHLLMDTGLGEGLEAGRISASVVIATAVVAALMLGVWIW